MCPEFLVRRTLATCDSNGYNEFVDDVVTVLEVSLQIDSVAEMTNEKKKNKLIKQSFSIFGLSTNVTCFSVHLDSYVRAHVRYS